MFTFLQYFSVYELLSYKAYKIVVLEELILTEIWVLLVFKVNIFQALVLNSLMCEFLKIDLGVWDSLLNKDLNSGNIWWGVWSTPLQ